MLLNTLAAFPALSTVPEHLSEANWVNGAQAQCEGTYIYALEMPDRPFLNSYQLGTRALDRTAGRAPALPTPHPALTPASSATSTPPPPAATPVSQPPS